MVEVLVPTLPPEHFLTPVSKDRRKVEATTYHNDNFDNPVIRQSANNSRGYFVPASQTSLETLLWCFFYFYFLFEQSTNGTNLVKKLSMPPLPMPLHLQSAEPTKFRSPVLPPPPRDDNHE